MRSVREMEAVSTVEVPIQPSRKLQDKHHTFWPRRRYQSRIERDFRGLPCVIAVIDFEAHKALHFCLEPLKKPSVKVMQMAIARHKERRCTCSRPYDRVSANLLMLAGMPLDLPCLRVEMDPWVLKLMEFRFRLVQPPQPIPVDWVDDLLERHNDGKCGCRPVLRLLKPPAQLALVPSPT